MDPITTLLSESDPVIAVVGATDNLHKYGSVIYRDPKAKGYRVYPVNPTRDTVDGDTVYRDLRELPETPDIVNIVVPPRRTMRVLDLAEELGVGQRAGRGKLPRTARIDGGEVACGA